MIVSVSGDVDTVLHIKSWTHFFDPGDAVTLPVSTITKITLRKMQLICRTFSEIAINKVDRIGQLCLEELTVCAENTQINETLVENVSRKKVNFTIAPYQGTQGKIDEL